MKSRASRAKMKWAGVSASNAAGTRPIASYGNAAPQMAVRLVKNGSSSVDRATESRPAGGDITLARSIRRRAHPERIDSPAGDREPEADGLTGELIEARSRCP